MENFTERFIIRDTEAGNPIDAYDDLATALVTWEEFIITDKKNKEYKPNFYELLDQETWIIYDESLNEKNIKSKIMTNKRRIFNRWIDNYVEEFDSEKEAIKFFKKYDLDEDYFIKKF